MAKNLRACVILVFAVLLNCGGGEKSVEEDRLIVLASSLPESSPAGEALAEAVVVEVRDSNGGKPVENLTMNFNILRGGGSAEPSAGVTGEDGRVSFEWTLGSAPVKNEALITDGHNILNIGISAVLDKPYAPEKFGDVENFLAAKNIEGTTEDLAFSPDGKLVLAVPDGLIFMDESGNASLQELAGDKLVSPLGIAYDSTGNLWVADSAGKALRKISPDFKVSTVLTGDGTQDFKQPNFTAIGYGGKVYLTDPCIKEILRIDPLTAKIEAIMTFDAATEGGPNGIVFDPEKKRAFVTTENIGLLCADGSVPIEDPVAGLYEIEITDQGFGAKKAVAANMGIFGDGATMDNEGNVYAIFDAKKKDEFALEESAVWIFPAEGGAPVKFISANDKILANLEFGSGAFGGKTLYISLLAVPVFGFNERGVVKFDVGIQGAKTLADFD